LNVEFTPEARAELLSIRNWIAADDERAADRVISRIRQTAILLGQFPHMGHEGEIEGTREFLVTGLPYIIVYRLSSATDLDILTIIHGRRKFPSGG